MALRCHQFATSRLGGIDNTLCWKLVFDVDRLAENSIARSSINDVLQDSIGIGRRSRLVLFYRKLGRHSSGAEIIQGSVTVTMVALSTFARPNP
jgi:hypothetical protein